MAQTVKKLPTIQETWVQSLGQQDPPEKGMAIHSSILACRILWTEESDGIQSMGSDEVDNDWVLNTMYSTVFIIVFVWLIFSKITCLFLWLHGWSLFLSPSCNISFDLECSLGPVFFLIKTSPCWPHPVLWPSLLDKMTVAAAANHPPSLALTWRLFYTQSRRSSQATHQPILTINFCSSDFKKKVHPSPTSPRGLTPG